MNPRAFPRGPDYMEFESNISSFLNPFKTKQGRMGQSNLCSTLIGCFKSLGRLHYHQGILTTTREGLERHPGIRLNFCSNQVLLIVSQLQIFKSLLHFDKIVVVIIIIALFGLRLRYNVKYYFKYLLCYFSHYSSYE